MKIGFFDSGLGGLTILRAVAATLPDFDYVYYGDTKNLPYGDRDEEEVYQLTKNGIQALFADDCILVIVACNTASAETLRRLQDTFLPTIYPDRRILGVIVPTIEVLLEHHVGEALLLATQRTVLSGKYDREMMQRRSVAKLTAVATPPLVRLIEAGDIDLAVSYATDVISAAKESSPEIDACILGCTHYTVLKQGLRERFQDLKILSQDEIIPEKLASYLEAHPEIAGKIHGNGERKIVLSEPKSSYDELAAQLLGGTFIGQ